MERGRRRGVVVSGVRRLNEVNARRARLVFSVHNDLVRAVDDCRVSQLVLLDLSAAFDTVDHQVLLCVLSDRFGISGTALNWFESYLSDRTQSFVHTGCGVLRYVSSRWDVLYVRSRPC